MLKLFETFKVVYEEENFTLAAEKLFIAQPTVSMQIQKLEEELATKLFIREGRKKVVPTESGKLFYQQVKKLLSDWDETIEQVQQLNGKIRLTCKIGASNTIAVYTLPQVLKVLEKQFPLIDFEIYLGNSEDVLKNVELAKWNFGLIETPLFSESLERIPVFKDELVLAGLEAEDLWLIREDGSGMHQYTMKYLAEFNRYPAKKMLVENNEMIVKMLEAGIGKSILSKKAIENIPYQDLPVSYQRFFYLVRSQEAKAWEQELTNNIIDILNKMQ